MLYQRITKILEKLTNDVEAELEERFHSLNRAFDAASQSVESIAPQVRHLQMEMDKASRILRDDLSHAVQVRESPTRRRKRLTKTGLSGYRKQRHERSASATRSP